MNNTSLSDLSFRLLEATVPGDILYMLFGSASVLANGLILFVFLRYKWFYQRVYVLLINLAVADLLTGVTCLTYGAKRYFLWYSELDAVTSSTYCLAELIPIEIALTGSQRLCFTIAIDRVVLVLFPIAWRLKLGHKYRAALITFAWTSSVIEACMYLAFSNDATIPLCMGYFSYPRNWYSEAVNYTDLAFNACTLVCYVVLPITAQHALKHCMPSASGKRSGSTFQKQMFQTSGALVGLYLLTTFGGVLWAHLLAGSDADTLARMVPLATCLMLLNSFLPIIVYAWKDTTFRQYLGLTLRGRCAPRAYRQITMRSTMRELML